jgi:hypothetical protein
MSRAYRLVFIFCPIHPNLPYMHQFISQFDCHTKPRTVKLHVK